METAGLMVRHQYLAAEHDLIGRLQGMQEREVGHLIVAEHSTDDEADEFCLDDPVVRTHSTEHEKALEEYRVYCMLVTHSSLAWGECNDQSKWGKWELAATTFVPHPRL
jgi:hypothetical protein